MLITVDEPHHLELVQLKQKMVVGFESEEELNKISKLLFNQVVSMVSFSPKFSELRSGSGSLRVKKSKTK